MLCWTSGFAQHKNYIRFQKHGFEDIHVMKLYQNHLITMGGYMKPELGLISYPVSYAVDYKGNLINNDTLIMPDLFYQEPVDEFLPYSNNTLAYSLNSRKLTVDSNYTYPFEGMAVLDSFGDFLDTIMLPWLFEQDSMVMAGGGIQPYSDSSYVFMAAASYREKIFFQIDQEGKELSRYSFYYDEDYFLEQYRVLPSGNILIWGTVKRKYASFKLYDSNFNLKWENVVDNAYGCDNGLGKYRVMDVLQGPKGHIFAVTEVGDYNVHGIERGTPAIFKMNGEDGTCEWFTQFDPPHAIALASCLVYDPRDSTMLVGANYDVQRLDSGYIPYKIPLSVAKVKVSDGALVWYREVKIPEMQNGYIAYPRDVELHGDTILLLGMVDFMDKDSMGEFTIDSRNPYLFYLNCDGFDSLPKADFNASSGENRWMEFYNSSTHSSEFYWDFGDGLTSTDTFPLHQYATEGFYTVTLITSSCSYADTIIRTVYASNLELVELTNNQGIVAYPNPVDHQLTLGLKEVSDPSAVSFEIVNMLGEILYQGSCYGATNPIDVGFLNPGMYHLRVYQTAKIVHNLKFIKS
ncbi:MAG: hypothetical protein ACI8ZO_000582 [Flavobacteriales bacterium]|jgi:hypothetical protein